MKELLFSLSLSLNMHKTLLLYKMTSSSLEMDKTTNFPQQEKKPPAAAEEEEEEEALSLRDFPLNSEIQDKRRSSSEPSEFFEFFNDFNSEMLNAEDIIFCGKLMPYYTNPPRILKSLSADDATGFYRRSLPAAARRSSYRPPCRPMECRRLISKPPPPAADIRRSSSMSSEGTKAVASKPRWFVMMFGPLKLRPEMDLRDIKNRQVRRSPVKLFGGGGDSGCRSGRRSLWGVDFLKVLSCKNHASVAVTASIGLVPHF